jgi:hypothetical protein
MNWMEEYLRRQRAHRRKIIARNVRAYRKRQKLSGMRRIDVALPMEQYSALVEAMAPGESISLAVSRLLRAVTGSRKSS